MKTHIYPTSCIHVIITTVLIMVTVLPPSEQQQDCRTLLTEVTVTKPLTYEYNGRLVRLTCVRRVNLRKCEGTCQSQVSPSVVHFPGFNKDCKCCQETALEQRILPMSRCYDGSTIVPGQKTILTIREPVSCACSHCSG